MAARFGQLTDQPDREGFGQVVAHPFGEQRGEPEDVKDMLVEDYEHGVPGERICQREFPVVLAPTPELSPNPVDGSNSAL